MAKKRSKSTEAAIFSAKALIILVKPLTAELSCVIIL
jgi:hypothetical protein